MWLHSCRYSGVSITSVGIDLEVDRTQLWGDPLQGCQPEVARWTSELGAKEHTATLWCSWGHRRPPRAKPLGADGPLAGAPGVYLQLGRIEPALALGAWKSENSSCEPYALRHRGGL